MIILKKQYNLYDGLDLEEIKSGKSDVDFQDAKFRNSGKNENGRRRFHARKALWLKDALATAQQRGAS